MTPPLDQTDRRLVGQLRRRPRAGISDLARRLELARGTVQSRLDRLVDRGVITGFGPDIDASCAGYDVRAFTTLVRFDAVYHGHFKCNRERLADFEHLWAYARDLYQTPGFGDTVDFDHIVRHYYLTHPKLNPSGIVPRGPRLDWGQPHGRERLAPDGPFPS